MHEPLLLAERAHGVQVYQLQRRIGRGLAKDHFSVRLDLSLNVLNVSEIHKVEFHAQRHELLAHDSVSSAVRALRDDAVVTRLHRRADRRSSGGHSSAEAMRG